MRNFWILRHSIIHFNANTNSVPDLGHFTVPILKNTPSGAICCGHFLFLSYNPSNSVTFCYQVISNIYKEKVYIHLAVLLLLHTQCNEICPHPSTVLFLKVSRKCHTTYAPGRFFSEIHVTLKWVTYFSVVRHDRKARCYVCSRYTV